MPHFFFFSPEALCSHGGAPAGVTDVDVSVSRLANLARRAVSSGNYRVFGVFGDAQLYLSVRPRLFWGDIRSIFSLVEKKRLGRQTLREERFHGSGGSSPRPVIQRFRESVISSGVLSQGFPNNISFWTGTPFTKHSCKEKLIFRMFLLGFVFQLFINCYICLNLLLVCCFVDNHGHVSVQL